MRDHAQDPPVYWNIWPATEKFITYTDGSRVSIGIIHVCVWFCDSMILSVHMVNQNSWK